MAACLLLFLVISAAVSVTMAGRSLRARAVERELPAVVGEIRNDILRQIGAADGLAGYRQQYLPVRLGTRRPAGWGMRGLACYAAKLKAVPQGRTVSGVGRQLEFMTGGT